MGSSDKKQGGWLAGIDPRMVARGLLVLVLVACSLQLALGTKPWETDVAERLAAKQLSTIDNYVAYGLWTGCAFSALTSLVLLATSAWWIRASDPPEIALTGRDGTRRQIFWGFLILILVIAAVPRLARMGHSFWGDEDWAYRDLIGGRFDTRAEDGSLKFKRHPWKVTAFWDKGTNNQYAYTLTARSCHDTWKKLSGAPPEQFKEWPLRAPSLVAGLASIAMGALLLRRMGFSRAGLVFAVLMAIHPWHLRYSSEARGYTMLLFFLLAGIYFLFAALERGRWRDWLLFGVFEFLSLYTWKAAVHPIAALNLAIFVVLVVERRREWLQYARWLVTNFGVLILFVPLFAPAIPQIQRKLAVSTQARGGMGIDWLKDVLAQLSGGVDWIYWGAWTMLVVCAAVILIVLGIGTLRGALGWLLLLAPIVGACLAFAHFSLTGNQLLKWYVFYTLPFFGIFIALGLDRLWWAKYIVVNIYAAMIFTILVWRVATPIQQSREAALVTRNADEGLLQMGPTDLVTVGLFRVSQSYDPRMRQARDLRSREALMEVVEECRAGGKELRVSAANLGYARENHADFMAVLEDPALFRKTGDFPAAERYLDLETYEMVGVGTE